MEINKKVENLALCAECGGRCCKNSGCGYLPKDFENMSFEHLKSRIDDGNISITAIFDPYYKNGKLISANPILLLRVKNIGKEVIDLFSIKTGCSVLTETGCPYPLEKRPSDGANLIPGKYECISYPLEKIITDWSNYQKVMQRLFRYYTNCSLEEQIRKDIINSSAEAYIELKKENGITDNLPDQIKSMFSFIDELGELFIPEIKEGKERSLEEYNKTYKFTNLKKLNINY